MKKKPNGNGTCAVEPQSSLRYGADFNKANNIACKNRFFAESSGYSFQPDKSSWIEAVQKGGQENPVTFYDSVTGSPLFQAPIGRSADDFIRESKYHGWPSFRNEEVVWNNVRTLKDGETVSKDGTHLGHNLPDRNGDRYCINLVSIAGNPIKI